ncbi:MAG: SDR family NAD(P)-dependent oxidoreductase [Rhodospirillales bacterium]|nr:SDR family NAD(P)-dependent oxidoreductase [Rhodospirillales bacterium]
MDFRTIVITGASSGIGASLSRSLAAPCPTLAFLGRTTECLESVSTACQARGATWRIASLDVSDTARLAAFLEDVGRVTPIDLMIAHAGQPRRAIR